MELKNVFGARLKNARVINGMSMDDLCAKMNNLVSKQTISKYESGKMLPNSTNLIALANALNVRPDYLLRPFTVSLDKIEFRKKSKMSVKEEKAIKEKIRDKIERYIEMLEEHCVKVIEMDAPDTFDGLSGIIGDRKPIIVLNKNFPVERKRFTAMHELGHLLLDFDDALPQKDVERFCNLFCCLTLMTLSPRRMLSASAIYLPTKC